MLPATRTASSGVGEPAQTVVGQCNASALNLILLILQSNPVGTYT
jgi:hypothetical protein